MSDRVVNEHIVEVGKKVDCADYWGCAMCPVIETCEAFAEAEDV